MKSMRDTSTTKGAASIGCARSTIAANFLFNRMGTVIVHGGIDNDFRAGMHARRDAA